MEHTEYAELRRRYGGCSTVDTCKGAPSRALLDVPSPAIYNFFFVFENYFVRKFNG